MGLYGALSSSNERVVLVEVSWIGEEGDGYRDVSND
jgi:hypothetical protein